MPPPDLPKQVFSTQPGNYLPYLNSSTAIDITGLSVKDDMGQSIIKANLSVAVQPGKNFVCIDFMILNQAWIDMTAVGPWTQKFSFSKNGTPLAIFGYDFFPEQLLVSGNGPTVPPSINSNAVCFLFPFYDPNTSTTPPPKWDGPILQFTRPFVNQGVSPTPMTYGRGSIPFDFDCDQVNLEFAPYLNPNSIPWAISLAVFSL